MEFTLSKADRAICNAITGGDDRPILQMVHIHNGSIEASNSFILAEKKITHIEGADELLLDAKSILRLKGMKSNGEVICAEEGENVRAIGEDITILQKQEGEYFKTEPLYPTTDPVCKFALSKKQLTSLLKCITEEDTLTFTFYSNSEPIKLEAGDVKGLIMQCKVK